MKLPWIKVEDKMPEDGTFLLYSDGQGIFSGCYMDKTWYQRTNWVELHPVYMADEAIKFWMPLGYDEEPFEPPKEAPLIRAGRSDGQG